MILLIVLSSIVAIHGLGGDAFRTWTEDTGHLWLRDSLPQHVPKARIFTYGYDSAVVFSRSRSQVNDYAIDLLYRLRSVRQQFPERPIMFVCHSLGGVVFKQALITASEQPEFYRQLLTSVCAVVFMGTPHRGSRTAGPALHLSRIINSFSLGGAVRSELIKALQVSSETLLEISRSSVPLMKDLTIVSFYEQKPLGPSLVSNDQEAWAIITPSD
jgi:pimeloyl-ACP methyl ester carboxylesterase